MRERLEELGGKPSKLKDAAGAVGGWAMVAFAASQPDTPGKLAMHAYSYEHMELAAYELLKRLAGARRRRGDGADGGRASPSEEARMAERLSSPSTPRSRSRWRRSTRTSSRSAAPRLPARRPRARGAGD